MDSGPRKSRLIQDGDGVADKIYRLENSDYVDYMPLVAVEAQEPILPVANFSTNATSGYPPLSVQFADLSENAVSWSWDFENDGNLDSTDENPVHAIHRLEPTPLILPQATKTVLLPKSS